VKPIDTYCIYRLLQQLLLCTPLVFRGLMWHFITVWKFRTARRWAEIQFIKRKSPGISRLSVINQFRGARTRRFITAFTTARQRSLSWARWIHSPTPPPQPINLLMVHFEPILPSTPWSFKRSFYFGLSHQNPVHVSPLSHACHMPCPPHSPWFDLPNNIWWW
jgi:hypothetical protein